MSKLARQSLLVGVISLIGLFIIGALYPLLGYSIEASPIMFCYVGFVQPFLTCCISLNFLKRFDTKKALISVISFYVFMLFGYLIIYFSVVILAFVISLLLGYLLTIIGGLGIFTFAENGNSVSNMPLDGLNKLFIIVMYQANIFYAVTITARLRQLDKKYR